MYENNICKNIDSTLKHDIVKYINCCCQRENNYKLFYCYLRLLNVQL